MNEYPGRNFWRREWRTGAEKKKGGGGRFSERAPQRQSLNNHVSSAGLHYPPVQQAECQPGLLAGCGKVNGGGKTSYCVTLERNGEGAAICQPGPAIPAEQMDTGGQRRGHRHP